MDWCRLECMLKLVFFFYFSRRVFRMGQHATKVSKDCRVTVSSPAMASIQVNALIYQWYQQLCVSDIHHLKDKDYEITLKTPGMEKLMAEYAAFKTGYLDDPVPYVEGWYCFTAISASIICQAGSRR